MASSTSNHPADTDPQSREDTQGSSFSGAGVGANTLIQKSLNKIMAHIQSNFSREESLKVSYIAGSIKIATNRSSTQRHGEDTKLDDTHLEPSSIPSSQPATAHGSHDESNGTNGSLKSGIHFLSRSMEHPIRISYQDPASQRVMRTIDFPVSSMVGDDIASVMQGLIAACGDSGTLGQGELFTNFHPHNMGIVDAIAQMILCDMPAKFLRARPQDLGVKASLSKLYVRTGSAVQLRFSTNPRPNSFGILIVCLPNPHTGGKLNITSGRENCYFDFGDSDAQSVHWVAMDNTCHNSVTAMQSGEQISLVYDLTTSERVGSVIGRNSSIMPPLFTFRADILTVLRCQKAFIEGLTIGYYCQHGYNHTRPDTENRLPKELLGIDAGVYSAFQELGIKISIRPVISPRGARDLNECQHECERDRYKDGSRFHRAKWQCRFLNLGRVTSGNVKPLSGLKFPSFDAWMEKRPVYSWVGTMFHEFAMMQIDRDEFFEHERLDFLSDSSDDETLKTDSDYEGTNPNLKLETAIEAFFNNEEIGNWACEKLENVLWINTPPAEGSDAYELAISNIEYCVGGCGEVSQDQFHSLVCFIIEIPADGSAERTKFTDE
ncbi:hypothetical protein BKA65DRAFT_581136 [Rhexocercosporidium sp. MPI-PUGE-AT-0058]|nr:hypothetical protein BKA65DRAFT_581136 [Rhexocercosporidium sp. MPI-PUGE-AT-0058]